MKKKLFHYTKLETLKLILESRKLRFTSLLNVDDQEEKWTNDMYDYAKHIFVCCFTDDEKESIPIWNMYSENGKGVRLEFEGEVFEKFSNIHNIENEPKAKVLVALNKCAYPVIYTDEEDKLFPIVNKEINGQVGHCISELGIYKNTHWYFQQEWRYSLMVYKFYNINGENMVDVRNVPIAYYDVPIKKDIIKNLKITLGYNATDIDKSNLQKIIDKFNQDNSATIELKDSILKGRIKK